MRNKFHLLTQDRYFLQLLLRYVLRLQLVSLVHLCTGQAFIMINCLRRRLSNRGVGVVDEGRDASISEMWGMKSSNQNTLDFRCVQVVKALPPRLWTATILR